MPPWGILGLVAVGVGPAAAPTVERLPPGPIEPGRTGPDPAARPDPALMPGAGTTADPDPAPDAGAESEAAPAPDGVPPSAPAGDADAAPPEARSGLDGSVHVQSPLPPPPPPEDTSHIARGPWRGVAWLDFQFDVVYPVAGDRPARGTVYSGAGTVRVGWRINNWVGLHHGVGFYVHDGEARDYTDAAGYTIRTIDYGRMTQWDLAVARFYAPLGGRVQPWLDVGGGALIYTPPFDRRVQWGGHFVGNLGFDGWVSTNFSLGFVFGYRLLGLADAMGHSLSTSFALGAHW